MAIRKWKDYFDFSRSEKVGIYLIISLILLFGSVNLLIPHFLKISDSDFSLFQQQIDSLKVLEQQADMNDEHLQDKSPHVVSRFPFDPNVASRDELEKLGFKSYVIDNLLNYRASGAVFRKKEDLLKVYGFEKEDYEDLESFICIEKRENTIEEKTSPQPTDPVQIDINTGTEEDFKKLKGIGDVLSRRIVEYRSKLGGFYAKNQVLDVYGIDSATYSELEDCLILSKLDVKKIAINFATIDEMKQHPYINYSLARILYDERTKNGPFASLDDLNSRCFYNRDDFDRIKAYVKIW
jgi:competence protein ComEA